MTQKESTKIDPLLEPLLWQTGKQEADAMLGEVIRTHAVPVIVSVIRYKLHLPHRPESGQTDFEDLSQEAVVQLLAELQKFQQQPDDHPVEDIRGLAAVIAYRACSGWMRRRFPERHAFRNHLYYLLTRQKGFALWRNEKGKLIAGFAAWRGQKNVAAREVVEQISSDAHLVSQIRLIKSGSRQSEAGRVLAELFDRLGNPVEFDRLVGFLAGLLTIEDKPSESTADDEAVFATKAAGGPDTAWLVEKRIFLERLCEEVRLLPRNQRAALLLNLRGTEGGCIALFPATGVASIRQLAEMLEIGVDELALLWNQLPLNDGRIGELLNLTRQQVINARKSARERLTRQLRGFL
jgi:DNA-directed RNA polymerase specialized sigma24 family protein